VISRGSLIRPAQVRFICVEQSCCKSSMPPDHHIRWRVQRACVHAEADATQRKAHTRITGWFLFGSRFVSKDKLRLAYSRTRECNCFFMRFTIHQLGLLVPHAIVCMYVLLYSAGPSDRAGQKANGPLHASARDVVGSADCMMLKK
jgi:hypothetical protein